MAYDQTWVFTETDKFHKAITALMPDEAYARLQQALVDDPELGDLIPGTGGMRKVRWILRQLKQPTEAMK